MFTFARFFVYLILIVFIINFKDNVPTVLPQMKEAYHGWMIIIGSIAFWDILFTTKSMVDENTKRQFTEKFVGTSLVTKFKYSILIVCPIIATIVLIHGLVIS